MSTMVLANVLLVLICCFQLGHSSTAEEYSSSENGNHRDRGPVIEETSPGTVGREFVFNFPTPWSVTTYAPILMISTPYISNVNVNISVSGIGFYEETTTNRQQHAEITLPSTTYLQKGSNVQDNTVIVHANAGVSVYGMTTEGYEPDGFLAIPVHGLGTEYLVATYGPSCSNLPTEFSLSSVEDQTDIQINTTTGQHITITMDAYQSYQIHDLYNDLTGSVIASNKPIAVMAGSEATGVPAGDGCDILLEALPSVDLFGYSFTIGPFMGRDGYVYRILAPEKAIVEISQYGMIDLDKGAFFEHDVNDDRVTVIRSSNHVLLMQYMKGSSDGKGDTSMVIVPPTEMFSGNVTFPVYESIRQFGYTYCINIIANCSYIPDMTYDDTIHVTNWERLSQGDMCVSRAEVTPGTHSVGHPDTDATFSVTVYGFRHINGFSYPAGFNMMPNAAPVTLPSETTSISLPTDSLTTSSEDPVSSIPPNDPQYTALQCGNNTMTVFIPKNIMRGVEAGDLHLVEDSCTGKDYNDTHISMSSAFEHCGTMMEVRGEYIVYSNVVLNEVAPVSPGIELTREHHVKIPVECYMRRNGTSNISFHPETSNIIFQEEGYGQFSFQMQLYPDNLYRIPYPAEAYPIDVHLQDMLYFEAKVSAQDGLVLFIDSCVATSTVNPYSSSRYNFLEDGCSKDSTLELYDSENPTTQRFGLEALGSIDADADSPIYIHCFLVLCNATDVTSRCALGCQSPVVNTRVLRSASSGSKPYLMTEGPIRFIETFEQDQIEGIIDSSNTGDNSNVLSILVASFSVVICFLGVVIVVLIKTRNKNVTRTG